MLIPNKFNGYQQDGRRTYPIGGGIGEAALIGAAMGGGSAALTGGDPLKGALLGGITGGIGGGIAGSLPGAQAAITPGLEAAAAATPATNAALAIDAGALSGAGGSITSPAVSSAIPTMNAGMTSGIGSSLPSGIAELAANPTGTITGPALSAEPGSFMEGVQRFANSPWKSIKGSPYIAGAAGLAGAYGGRRPLEMPGSPKSDFADQFDWRRFQPTFAAAEGGITSLAAGGYDKMVGEQPMYQQEFASGGISSLGSYSDGGRMLRGPGDGMSDSIPGVIAGKRPARLADGEFVIPADVVSHLGNGSTDAGARQLYAMMDKVRRARTGRKKQGREINPRKFMPA